jgi:hypothetical protein
MDMSSSGSSIVYPLSWLVNVGSHADLKCQLRLSQTEFCLNAWICVNMVVDIIANVLEGEDIGR